MISRRSVLGGIGAFCAALIPRRPEIVRLDFTKPVSQQLAPFRQLCATYREVDFPHKGDVAIISLFESFMQGWSVTTIRCICTTRSTVGAANAGEEGIDVARYMGGEFGGISRGDGTKGDCIHLGVRVHVDGKTYHMWANMAINNTVMQGVRSC
jgi:hypothetical protein